MTMTTIMITITTMMGTVTSTDLALGLLGNTLQLGACRVEAPWAARDPAALSQSKPSP